MIKRVLVLVLCRWFGRHTPPEKVSEPKEIGLGQWWVEESGTCRLCGTWRRRRRPVPPPPCDHVFPHVCAACREQAEEEVWSKVASVPAVRDSRPAQDEDEVDEDRLIDVESGVRR